MAAALSRYVGVRLWSRVKLQEAFFHPQTEKNDSFSVPDVCLITESNKFQSHAPAEKPNVEMSASFFLYRVIF